MGGRRMMLPLMAVALAACTTGGGSGRGTGDITTEELQATAASDCLQAVRTLRPQWLRARAAPTPGNPNPVPRVVVDGTPRGEVNELSLISASDVEIIRFLSSSDATIRFGTGFPAGAIEVVTRR